MNEQQQRIKDVGEVFTPEHIVNDMIDLLPADYLQVETTILEPSVGEGVFLCEILKRKLRLIENGELRIENDRIAEILQTLYGVDIMLDNVRKTRENLLDICLKHCDCNRSTWEQILKNNIRWGDTLACFEAKSEEHNGILCLRDLTKEQIGELQFFDYSTKKWVKYINSFDHAMREEIKQQRNEYRNILNSQLSIFN